MAGMTHRRLSEDARGVSDVLALAFMFLIVIFGGVLLHGYRFGAINSASARQLQLKTEYLYKTFELAQVDNYSLSFFQAISENLIQVTPQVVPGEYLRERVKVAISYLIPPDYAAMVELKYENSGWVQVYPEDAGTPGVSVEKYLFAGKVTTILARGGENRIAQVDASVTMFQY